jgi:hypothetical protein
MRVVTPSHCYNTDAESVMQYRRRHWKSTLEEAPRITMLDWAASDSLDFLITQRPSG